MHTSPCRRSSSRWSATTRSTIAPTVRQPTRSSRVIGENAICWVSHATTSSKSRVWCPPALAHGTASSRTPQSRQRSSRSSHSIQQRLAPRSRCRQRLTRRPWISSRPVWPQVEQTRRRRLSRTVTTTPSAVKLTSITDAPGRRSSRLNAVVTRTSPSSQGRCPSNSQQPARRAAARHSRSAHAPKNFLQPRKPCSGGHRRARVHPQVDRRPGFKPAVHELSRPLCAHGGVWPRGIDPLGSDDARAPGAAGLTRSHSRVSDHLDRDDETPASDEFRASRAPQSRHPLSPDAVVCADAWAAAA